MLWKNMELLPTMLSNYCLQTSLTSGKKIKATSSRCLSNDQVKLSKQARANTLGSFKTQQSKVHCAPSTVQFVSVDLQQEDNKHTLSYKKDLQPTVRSVLPSFMPQMSQQSS